MAEPTVDVLAVYDAAIFQRRRKLHLLTDKGAPQRAIDRQRDWLAKAEAARAALTELIEADREYDAANAALNQAETDWSKKFDAAFATTEEWAPLNAAKSRVFVATTRRAAALARVGGAK